MGGLYDLVYDHYLSNKDPEDAHDLAVDSLELAQEMPGFNYLTEKFYNYSSEVLEQELWDIEFENPVGVAAGFDKSARIVDGLHSLGFGYVEAGGVTPEPQEGNDKPRMFRVPEEEAVVNRMGFKNDGSEEVETRMQNHDLERPVGLNLGERDETPYKKAAVETLADLENDFDYAVANLSCPNMGDSRVEDDEKELNEILTALEDHDPDIPLLMKISPDAPQESVERTVDLGLDYEIDGIIATNTSSTDGEDYPEGGLSGEPIREAATETVREVYRIVEDDVPVIGVGGVSSAEDVWEKIVNGASMVQLYTGLVYEGPGIARDINKGLEQKVERNGYDSISEAVGTEVS